MTKKMITRIKAAAIHFLFSVLIALTATALIFYVWYPHIFAEILGGFRLFFLVVGCDVVIGPCLTFIIFNIAKSRKALFLDCSIIVALQLAALSYGMSVVAESRPVYIVFVKDRLEVTTAIEFEPNDFKGLTPETEKYRAFPWNGPVYVSIKYPQDKAERQSMLFKTVSEGRDYQFFLKYYQPYADALAEVRAAVQPISQLKLGTEEKQKNLREAIEASGFAENELGWLLVKHRFGFCTALINQATGYPVSYLQIDPISDDAPEIPK